jgi:hypothetical protein
MAAMVTSHFLKLAVVSSLFALSSLAYEVPIVDTGPSNSPALILAFYTNQYCKLVRLYAADM